MNKLVVLKEVSFSFSSNLPVLENINLEIKPGDFISVVGPSGSGKTTLLNLISKLIEPAKGNISIKKGVKIRTVFQEPLLLPWRNVAQNIKFGLEIEKKDKKTANEKAKNVLNLVGLKGYDQFFPNELSGGMKQRVSLARALACSPDIVLLDEPFSNLDELSKIELQQEILNIWDKTKTSFILVTHNISEAALLGQKIIVFSQKKPTCIKKIITKRKLDRLSIIEEEIRETLRTK